MFILGDAAKLIWGREDHSVAVPAALDGSMRALGLTFPTYRLFLIVVGVAVAIGLWAVLQRTRWGILVRAATMDRAMLSALGVNTRRLFTTVSRSARRSPASAARSPRRSWRWVPACTCR